MSKRPLSQEGLKFLACAIMLLDHIGATLIPWGTLRIIGRLAFPIFCFLLAEGAHYTRNPRNYLLRLGIGAILSELPFDLALFGSWSWQHQSVMITLLLGAMALLAMKRMTQPLLKILVLLLFAFLADFMNTDYGGAGVLMIALFGLTRERKYGWLVQLLGMYLICRWIIPGGVVWFIDRYVFIEIFAILALIPIWLYSGKKSTSSRAVQWAFYLFYPVHLWILYLISILLA